MSLSYSFPYAGSTIYTAVNIHGQHTVQHRSTAARRSSPRCCCCGGWDGTVFIPKPQVPLVRAKGWFRFAVPQMSHGMVWDAF